MTRLWLICLLGWQAVAGAQTSVPETAIAPGAERQRIAAERASHEATFRQAEGQCYSRFAVSDCLREARKERRFAMDELRRQELLLNDMERKTKALEALKRIENKLATQQQKTSPEPAQTNKLP